MIWRFFIHLTKSMLCSASLITQTPSLIPTLQPTLSPTFSPTMSPTFTPTLGPTLSPTLSPTLGKSKFMCCHCVISCKLCLFSSRCNMSNFCMKISHMLTFYAHFSLLATLCPTLAPTLAPTLSPTLSPTLGPTLVSAASLQYSVWFKWLIIALEEFKEMAYNAFAFIGFPL